MITLSQYLGFIFREVSRARQIADAEALRIAQLYAQDGLLKHLSVPRFKVPEMELSVPVVIAGAQFRNTLALTLSEPAWVEAASAAVQSVLDAVLRKIRRPREKAFDFAWDRYRTLRLELGPMHARLARLSPESDLPAAGIETGDLAAELFAKVIDAVFDLSPEVASLYREAFPDDGPRLEAAHGLRKIVVARVVVTQSTLENLLVSPETSTVRNEGTALSVFQIRARITEEGLSVRSVKSPDGRDTPIVDLD